MGGIIECKCGYCGEIYKFELTANYITFCPRCKKYDISECEYGYGAIVPCNINIGGDVVGEINFDDGCYKLSVPFLDINERLSNGEDTLYEAMCIGHL